VTATAPPDRAHRVPPGPSRWETPKQLAIMATDRLRMMSAAAARYGDAVRFSLGPKTLYFFNHPDQAKYVLADNAANYHKGIGLVHAKRALGDGLLTSEGELWRKQRRTIQPVFQAKRLAGQAGVVAAESGRMVHRLRAASGRGPVNVLQEMTGFTLGVLGAALLDADLTGFTTIGHSFEAVQDQAMFEMETLGIVPTWVPLPKQLRFRRARAELQRIVDQLVARRLAVSSPDGDDVLTRLIQSTMEEEDPRVGRVRMRDELVTLLLAGHETTASTLSWTFWLLDKRPDVWERLHAEAVDVLGDRPPDFESLHRLKYTTMVVEEVMRLYPPVWILPRRAVAEDEIDGYHIPAGADVLVCPYTLHRHPEFWPQPDRFDPDRFDPDVQHDRPRYAHIPFGAGPRFCVGNHLGMMEAAFVIATVTREMRLAAVPGFEAVPEPMLSLRVRGGRLPMTVHPVS